MRINTRHRKVLASSLGNFFQESVWTVAAIAEGLGPLGKSLPRTTHGFGDSGSNCHSRGREGSEDQ